MPEGTLTIPAEVKSIWGSGVNYGSEIRREITDGGESRGSARTERPSGM